MSLALFAGLAVAAALHGCGSSDDTDAGSGDDHVVGGHWMTATDGNVPVNTGNYDATVTALTRASYPALHSIYDDGPMFSVDLSGLNLSGSISGQIWLDLNGNDTQNGTDVLFTQEVVVSLYDCGGNLVNSVVTTNGTNENRGV